MSVLNSLFSAFAMYSRIPVPRVEWNENNKRFALCFFPLIGLFSGGLMVLWFKLSDFFGINSLLYGCVAMLIPVFVTGGIHLDGYIDVCDAKSSFADREKLLEIMKDSHIGAFAAIHLVCYLFLYAALWTQIGDVRTAAAAALMQVSGRAFSALAAVTMKNAKGEGTLSSFTVPAHKRITVAVQLIYLALVSAALACIKLSVLPTALVLSAAVYLYYRRFSKKRFGGITGDLEGYFFQVYDIVNLAGFVVWAAL